MIRYFVLRIGDWMIRDWCLYRWREHRNHNGKVRWHDWDRITFR
jgi:hypothetical protein